MPTACPFSRVTLRAAVKIREHLLNPPRYVPPAPLPEQEWLTATATHRRLEQVMRRGWRTAAEHLARDWDYDLQRLRRQLDQRQFRLPQDTMRSAVMPLADIAHDLEALEQEFEGFRLKLQERSLEVLTDSIILERLNLGPFRIVLRWEKIGEACPYRVVAQSPVVPGHDSEVTHPHVRDEHLCEGEGAAAVRSALAQGRLLDFFTLVRQILETYNPSSAYVSIDRWEGVGCRDCGDRLPADDYSSCERCDDPLCGECSVSCGSCDRLICAGCSINCADCGTPFCIGCLDSHSTAGRQLCGNCLEESCKEPTLEDEDAQQPAAAAGQSEELFPGCPAAALDPLCLGEAPVPA